MASLTETAFYARRFIKWGSIGLVVFMILRILFGMTIAYIRSIPKPVKPNYKYGQLPPIIFPDGEKRDIKIEYSLQTLDGKVPRASDTARVHIMPKSSQTLLSLSNAESFVKKLKFEAEAREITSSTYQWIDSKNQLRSIEMDIINRQFRLKYFYPYDLGLFAQKQVPSPQQAISEGARFLQSANVVTSDINLAQARVIYLKLVGNTLEPTTSQSQADATKIVFYRNSLNGMPIVHDLPSGSNVEIILSSSSIPEKRVLDVDYHYWSLDRNNFAIYPLISSTKAWEKLNNGEAYIAQYAQDPTKAAITSVYLGYYDSRAAQKYLQPIFIFIGEKGFTAYVDAVDRSKFKASSPTPQPSAEQEATSSASQ